MPDFRTALTVAPGRVETGPEGVTQKAGAELTALSRGTMRPPGGSVSDKRRLVRPRKNGRIVREGRIVSPKLGGEESMRPWG